MHLMKYSAKFGDGSENKDLFPTESAIKDSAIYKASPLHKLTKEQEKARELIIQKVSEALEKVDRKIWESCNKKAIQNRTLSDGTKQRFGEILIQHEVRVLMP